MSNDYYIDNNGADEGWWQQQDEDAEFQQEEEKQARALEIRETLLIDKSVPEAFGYLSMLVIELEDKITQLEKRYE